MSYENVKQGASYRSDKEGNVWLFDIDSDETYDIKITNSNEGEL